MTNATSREHRDVENMNGPPNALDADGAGRLGNESFFSAQEPL